MKKVSLFIAICFIWMSATFAQPEVYPWGNISGIRLDGKLMVLNSSLGLVGQEWSDVFKTAKEKASYQYSRKGNTQFTNISKGDFYYNQSVEGLGAGRANVRINFRNEADTAIIGTFCMLDLPASKYDRATIQLIEANPGNATGVFSECQDEILRGTAMGLPLLVGEGCMDAGAWRYPDIFNEYTYAMEEMNLYVRILKICQPESILQCQLTADYSPMKGGGVFGETNVPLTPTQRFWNFKQIADMLEGLFAMQVEADNENITCAALGDNNRGLYVVHVVNNGPSRMAALKGLPSDVRRVTIFVTNDMSSMSKGRRAWVRNGTATFFAESNSFITLMVDGESPY